MGEPVLQNMNHLYIIIRISSFHWESQYTEYESSLYHHPNIIVSLGEPVLQNMNHLYIITQISSFIGRASITEYESSLYHHHEYHRSLGEPVLQNMNHLYIIIRISSFHWESQYYRIWIIFISSSEYHRFIGKASITEYESSLYHHPNIIVSLGRASIQNMNHLYIIVRISSFHWESAVLQNMNHLYIIIRISSFIGRASITEYESSLYHHPNIIVKLGEASIYRIWIIFISSSEYHRFIGRASITEYESSLYHHPNIIVKLGEPVLQNMNHLYIIIQISSFHWESQVLQNMNHLISSSKYHRFIGKASITEYESSLYHHPNIIVNWESQYYRIWIIFISSSKYHRFIGKASITEYESSLYHHPNIIVSLGEPVLQNMNHLYIITQISSFHWESQYYRIWIIFISSSKYHRFIGKASITEYESSLYHHPNIIVSLGKPVLQNMNHLYIIIVRISSFHWESQYYRIWIIFISSPKYHRFIGRAQYYRIWIIFISSPEYHPFIGRASITEYESSLYHHRPKIILSLGKPVLQNMNHLYIIVRISSFHWESQYYRIWIIFISSSEYHRFIGKASITEYESSLYHHPNIIVSLGKPVLQNMNHLYIITRISSFHWESQYYRIWIIFISSSSQNHPFIGKPSIIEYESSLYHHPNIILSLGEPVLQNMNHLYIITQISSFHWESQYYRIWIIFISSSEYHPFIGRASSKEYESSLYHHPNIIVSLGKPVLQNMNHLYIITQISSFHWESQYYRIWIIFISSSEYHRFIGKASITEYESFLYHRPNIIVSLGKPVLQNMNHLYIITQYHRFIGKASITEYESSLYHRPNIIVSLGEPVLQNMNHLYIITRISSFHWESQYYRIWIIFISSSKYHRFIGKASITEYESSLYHHPNIIVSLGEPVLQNMNHLYIITQISSFHWESQYYRIWIIFISSPKYHPFIGRASITEYESSLYHCPNIILSLGKPVLQNMNHLYIIVQISSFHWESQYYRIWIIFISSPKYHRFIGKASITEYESSLYHRPNIIVSLGKPVLQNMNHLYIITQISSFHWESQYYRIWIIFISSPEYHRFIGRASITEYESSLYHHPNIIVSLGEPVLQNMNHLYIITQISSFHWESQYYRIWIIFISLSQYHPFIGRASITEYESSLYHHQNIIVHWESQ